MKIQLSSKKLLIIALCIIHSNAIMYAMMSTVAPIARQTSQVAGPALGVAAGQWANNFSGNSNSINVGYNPQVKNYNTGQQPAPQYSGIASGSTKFNQYQQPNNTSAQYNVDVNKAFRDAEIDSTQDAAAMDENMNDDNEIDNATNNIPAFQPRKLDPTKSIAQNLYGNKPASLFAQQRRDYSTFRPKSDAPHDILGVSPTATQTEIKAAYLQLAKQYHPDVVDKKNREEATIALQKINNAYDKLRDSNYKYDSSQKNKNSQQSEYQYQEKREPIDIKDAIKKRDIQAVNDCIRRGGINFDGYNQYGDTLLIQAIKECSKESIQTFLTRSGIQEREEPQYQIVKALLQAGMGVNQPNKQGQTPLLVAIMEGKLDVVDLLKSIRGATAGDLNKPDKKGITLLMQAFIDHKSARAKALIKSGADITRKDALGNTALHYAIKNYYHLDETMLGGYRIGYQELLDAYVEHNISFYTPNNEGKSPYDEAGQLSSISNRSAAHELRYAIEAQERKGFRPSKPFNMHAQDFASGVRQAGRMAGRVTGEMFKRSTNWQRNNNWQYSETHHDNGNYSYSYSYSYKGKISMTPIIITAVIAYFLLQEDDSSLNTLIDNIQQQDPTDNLNVSKIVYSNDFIAKLEKQSHSPEAILTFLINEGIIHNVSPKKIKSFYRLDEESYIVLEDMHHTIDAVCFVINHKKTKEAAQESKKAHELGTLHTSLEAIKNQLEHILSYTKIEQQAAA